MSEAVEGRLVNEDGASRLRTVAISIGVSLVVLTAIITLTYQLLDSTHGWLGSFGVGFGASIWLCVLAGAVVGNGIHELRHERAAKQS